MHARKLRAGLLAGAALAVGAWSARERGHEVDSHLFRGANAGHGPLADAFFAGVTEFGSLWASVGAAGSLATLGRRRPAARALGASGAAWILGQALKRAFDRPRPYDAYPSSARLRIGKPPAMSWPSSHAMVLLAFCTVAERELRLGRSARVVLGALAGAVGVSRTYLGVHYPSDVIGGLLLGRAFGLAWPSR